MQPDRYASYAEDESDGRLRRIGVWLASTLTWFPLFVASVGAVLNFTSVPQLAGGIVIGLTLIAWLVTGYLGQSERTRYNLAAAGIAFIVALVTAQFVIDRVALSLITFAIAIVARGVAVTAALGEASDIASGVSVAVAVSGAVLLAGGAESGWVIVPSAIIAVGGAVMLGFGIKQTLEDTLEQQRPNIWSRFIFITLMLSYAGLVWIYLLGGWHVLFDVQ